MDPKTQSKGRGTIHMETTPQGGLLLCVIHSSEQSGKALAVAFAHRRPRVMHPRGDHAAAISPDILHAGFPGKHESVEQRVLRPPQVLESLGESGRQWSGAADVAIRVDLPQLAHVLIAERPPRRHGGREIPRIARPAGDAALPGAS